MQLKKIKVIALDTNGVLTTEVYCGAIRRFVELHNGLYTEDVERLVFGSPHAAGGHIMSVLCKLPWTAEETIQAFLIEQKKGVAERPAERSDGISELLHLLRDLNVRVTAYGGSPRETSFDPLLKDYIEFFDDAYPYVDMGKFRPGMKEIAGDVFKCAFDEILFIDDLNRVAEVSRVLGAGFVGFPSGSFQRKHMQKTGVNHIVDSLREITSELLFDADRRLHDGTFWA